jgi:DNA mismatch repair protein MutS
VFLHRVVAGGADRSYGVHVAQLAGLPRPVVERARALLRDLETAGSTFEPQAVKQKRSNPGQLKMFDDAPNPAVEALKAIKVDELSPLEALTKLYELKRLAGE